jgi:hypothetical protein
MSRGNSTRSNSLGKVETYIEQSFKALITSYSQLEEDVNLQQYCMIMPISYGQIEEDTNILHS